MDQYMQLFRLSIALMLVVLVQVGAVAATCAGCALQRYQPPKSCGLLPHVLAYGQVHLDEHPRSWGPLAVDVTLVSTDPLGRTIHRAAARTTSELFFQVCMLLLSSLAECSQRHCYAPRTGYRTAKVSKHWNTAHRGGVGKRGAGRDRHSPATDPSRSARVHWPPQRGSHRVAPSLPDINELSPSSGRHRITSYAG